MDTAVKPRYDSEAVKPRYDSEAVKPRYDSEAVKRRYDSEAVKRRYDSEAVKRRYDSEAVKRRCDTVIPWRRPRDLDIIKRILLEKTFHVYILASRRNGTLYVGVTSDLIKRVWQHKSGEIDGFTKKYSVKNLVYYEEYSDAKNAIQREKRLKEWRRIWKISLIEKFNPNWDDLYGEIIR